MRHKRLKLSAVLLLVLGLTGLQAQTMYVKESSGTQAAYTLSNIQKMSFSSGNLTVTKTDNSSGVYALSGLQHLSFTNTPADTQPPTAPGNLITTATTNASVSISWNASTDNVGVTYYLIYKDGVKIDSVTTTAYTATELVASTPYTFTVKARDAANNISEASDVLSVTTSTTTDNIAPSTPANLVATGKTATTISLSWNESTDNVGVTYYLIYKDGVKIDSVTTTAYTATELVASTPYTFTVKARDAANNISTPSDVLSVTTSTLTSINDLRATKSNILNTYPSPVEDILNVDLTGHGAGSVSILTIEGKLLQEQKTDGATTLTLNLSQISKGIYLCRYVSTKEIKTVKIIKQ